MAMIPIVDALRENLPVGAGVTRDDTAARPKHYRLQGEEAGRLWIWPLRDELAEQGTGRLDEGRFTARLVYGLATYEPPGTGRTRAPSVALDDAADAIAAWVRHNRTRDDAEGDVLWEDLQVRVVEYDAIANFEGRAFAMTLGGYRQIG